VNKKIIFVLLISLSVFVTGCGNTARQAQQSKTAGKTQQVSQSQSLSQAQPQSQVQSKSQPQSQPQTITYKQYVNGRYGFSIDYPSTFITKLLPDNSDGIVFSTQDDSAELTASGINNVLGDTAASYYNQLTQEHSNASYKMTKDNWVIVSWADGDSIFYEKDVIGAGSINSFTFKYPAAQKDYYSPIVSHLDSSFKTPFIDDTR
jgi:serine/threonine-protein kinase